MIYIRSALFTILFCLGTVLIGIASLLFLQWLSYERSAKYVVLWNRWIMIAARICSGLDWKVQGKENVPDKPVVFLSNHESQGETYFLQFELFPVSTVLKKELLKVPFFGLGLKLTHPIAIDRDSPKKAMQTLLKEGVRRIELGRNVLVFPQGTRQPYPSDLKYARGGAAIAVEAGCDIVPVAHNASKYWPAKGFLLKQGVVDVIIGEPISTEGRNAKELNKEVRDWTENVLKELHKDT